MPGYATSAWCLIVFRHSLIGMQISIDGLVKDFKDGVTVREALKALGHNPEIYLVAVNGTITHENTVLQSGDSLDLVKIISGG